MIATPTMRGKTKPMMPPTHTDERRAVNVRFPSDLAEWLRQYAFDNRTSQNEIVVTALREFRERAEEQTAE